MIFLFISYLSPSRLGVCVRCVCRYAVSHTVQDLVFIWNMTDPLVVNDEIELPQQDISKIYTTDCTIEYSTGNFTCLAVVFELRRRLGYHLFHTYIPSALIVVMSWISFWIKPEAIPARITLGVTSLLTLGWLVLVQRPTNFRNILIVYTTVESRLKLYFPPPSTSSTLIFSISLVSKPHKIHSHSNRCHLFRMLKRWIFGCRHVRCSCLCR